VAAVRPRRPRLIPDRRRPPRTVTPPPVTTPNLFLPSAVLPRIGRNPPAGPATKARLDQETTNEDNSTRLGSDFRPLMRGVRASFPRRRGGRGPRELRRDRRQQYGHRPVR